MHLPNAHLAVIDREKITDYLLNPAHPDNGGKARFFKGMEYSTDEWAVLAQALRAHAVRTPVARRIESKHGRKYVLEGPLTTPSGRPVNVRTVWIIDRGSQTPRLVTAYPYA